MNDIEKKIFDTLASGGGINLPGVGTLFVERQGAKLLAKGKVRPPQNKVSFSPGTNAAFGSADGFAGYAQWLSESVRKGNVLEITGVGILRRDVFYPSVELYGILNPGGGEPVKVRRKASAWKKTLVGILVVGAAALVLWLVVSIDFWTRKDEPQENSIAYQEQRDASARGESTIAPAIAAEAEEEIEAGKAAKEEAAVEDVIQKQLEGFAARETESSADAAGSNTYYLVAGVFAEAANADKMIASDPLKIGSGNYAKMPFGGKTLVSAFSSKDKAEVEKRRRELSRYNDTLWIYERAKK